MVSVVVLTRNRKELLGRCLLTLTRQDLPAWEYEVVVVDDGSEDGTRDEVQELGRRHANLRHARQPYRGIPAARNRGLAEARGAIVAFVADDYELAPDYVRTIRHLLADETGNQVVRFKVVRAGVSFSDRVGHSYYRLSTLRRLLPRGGGTRAGFLKRFRALARWREEATTDHHLEAAGGAAYRREVFAAVGAFDESLLRGEDSDFAARLRHHNIPVLYFPFHHIRRHYEPFFREGLAKSYRAGLYRYQFRRKHSAGGEAELGRLLVMSAALVHCARTGGVLDLIFSYPWLLLLEAFNKVGFLAGVVRELVWPRGRAGR